MRLVAVRLARVAHTVVHVSTFGIAMALLIGASAHAAAPGGWTPVDPADLASKESATSPGAHLEYLFWRTWMNDADWGLEQRTHVRAKIYTRQGVEAAGKMSIEISPFSKLKEIAARVVKPGGTTVELKKTDFIESVQRSIGDYKVRRTSFAFPNLEPGDIIEYRWKSESRWGSIIGWYYCQQDGPIREYVMDVEAPYAGVQATWFNTPKVDVTKPTEESIRLVIRNLPAFDTEPHMPPELDSRGWIRLGYEAPRVNWKWRAEKLQEQFDENTKPNDAMKKKAAELTAGAADDEAKIRALHEFCRLQIVNIKTSDDAASRAERESRRERTPQIARETLKRGRGLPEEINDLFGALLKASGFEPRGAECASNAQILHNRSIEQGWLFNQLKFVALKRGNRWAFYNPGRGLLPFGVNDHFMQGSAALIGDANEAIFQAVPAAPAEVSKSVRKARFTLDAEGGVDGTVEITYTGHVAARERTLASDSSQEDVDREVGDDVKKRIPGAEVSEVQWENLRDRDGPVVLRYKVTIPGYAEAAGQRLVLTPSYFTRGVPAAFTAPERKQMLFWRHGWVDEDDIEFVLPPTLEIEQANSPRGIAEQNGLLLAKYDLGFSPRRHTLVYKRRFAFDVQKGGQLFPKETYPLFKNLFDELATDDKHSVVLRRRAQAPVAAGAAPTPANEAKPAGS